MVTGQEQVKLKWNPLLKVVRTLSHRFGCLLTPTITQFQDKNDNPLSQIGRCVLRLCVSDAICHK
jgi:hypothetical protein